MKDIQGNISIYSEILNLLIGIKDSVELKTSLPLMSINKIESYISGQETRDYLNKCSNKVTNK